MCQTVEEARRWASSFLQRAGISERESQFAAERLLRHLLQWERARFFAYRETQLPPKLWPKYERLIMERAAGAPLQHLVKYQEFYGRDFRVSPDVLIPRPETEVLVEEVLQTARFIWGEQPCAVVDVGTGSGAIAVTLAAEQPSWQVAAVDLSPAALRVATHNAAAHGVGERMRFLEDDLLTSLVADGEQFDIVVSNPPYIPTGDIVDLAVEVREHEPRLALDGGTDGLAVYRRLTAMLPSVVKEKKGLVAFEVGIFQSGHVARLLQQALPFSTVRTMSDLQGIARVVLASWQLHS
ncbi:peptide chain release factor N(5)-glutamine methyltransferase [Numidum massiliense]|uniref:peptide chain release factor N(5)-glutamine methyltransferase n=1 Tax=Numidum massiliense TaxID=1522315 RepID=UPI0006D56588|nr:peptide chain release factor N(5)-glutamine methyltransferase [Numidum massiliense]